MYASNKNVLFVASHIRYMFLFICTRYIYVYTRVTCVCIYLYSMGLILLPVYLPSFLYDTDDEENDSCLFTKKVGSN